MPLGGDVKSAIPVESLGVNGQDKTIVMELRITHPIDGFTHSRSEDQWRDLLQKWRTFLQVQGDVKSLDLHTMQDSRTKSLFHSLVKGFPC